ncbi:Fungal specific transcription factor domain [Ceratobasidium sp. AG-Ba]|nr:Fungal specific transcription factor domain [Ceratobasidium sp. AG-Ba]
MSTRTVSVANTSGTATANSNGVTKPRACQTCRTSKHKCDGDEHSTAPCSRCFRSGKQCVWPARKPMGRPRKPVMAAVSMTSSPAVIHSSVSPNTSPAPGTPSGSPTSSELQLARSASMVSDYFVIHDSFSPRPQIPRPKHSARDIEMRNLIEKYFSIPHHYVPLLRPRQEFLLNLPTTTFLTTSILALASRYAYRASSNDYRELALSQASVTNEALERPIEFAQAMILLAYLEYGLGNVANAAKLNKQTIDHVLQQGWHRMDEADGPACQEISIGSAGGLIPRPRPRTGWNGLGEEPGPCPTGTTNGFALEYYERDASAFGAVYFCGSFPQRSQQSCIPIEAMAFPTCITQQIRDENTQKLTTLDVMIDNALLEGFHTWSDAVQGMNDRDSKIEWLTVRTTCFMSLLVLNAAMIHLHHRYAIPNLHFNFNVCSVAPSASGLAALAAIATGNAPMSVSTETEPPLAIPPASVAKITTSSRSILTLFRDSQRAALAQAVPTLHAPESEMRGPADVTPAQMDDILRQSPFCGCSQVIASFGSAIEVATAAQKYQALAAYSNLETATHILKRLKSLWPVAGAYEEELTKCHTAVQSALESW